MLFRMWSFYKNNDLKVYGSQKQLSLGVSICLGIISIKSLDLKTNSWDLQNVCLNTQEILIEIETFVERININFQTQKSWSTQEIKT